MGKRRQKPRISCASGSSSDPTLTPTATDLRTTTAIASDPSLGYKFRVLLYDFTHLTKDPYAERRINETTNEHYISLPYFSEDESDGIKSAIVDVDFSQHTRSPLAGTHRDQAEGIDGFGVAFETLRGKPFHEVVQILLASFIDKRRASGDARPCGPHHLAPMYASLFGVDLEELREQAFLGRLRRTGI